MVIQNRSSEEKKFNIEFEYLPEKPGIPSAEANHVVVTTSTSSVTVAAGQLADLTATIQVPADFQWEDTKDIFTSSTAIMRMSTTRFLLQSV